jgi:phosphoglycerate dehydrogenase-like enzyme
MPTILIGPYLLRNQPGPFRKILSDAGFELIDPEGDFALTHEQLQSYLPRADAMLAGGERLTADLFELAPWLRVVARTGVGYDLIDLRAATSRNIVVTITRNQHSPRRPDRRGRSPRQPGLGASRRRQSGRAQPRTPEPGNPLLGLPTVVFSPHIAGTDLQSMSDMAELAARTIVELYHNRWPAACVVNGDVRQGWRW